MSSLKLMSKRIDDPSVELREVPRSNELLVVLKPPLTPSCRALTDFNGDGAKILVCQYAVPKYGDMCFLRAYLSSTDGRVSRVMRNLQATGFMDELTGF